MSSLQLFVDNKLTQARNLDSISWDFVASDGSPNAILVNELELELVKLGFADSEDGVVIIRNFIQAFGLLQKVRVQLIDSTIGTIFEGFGDVSRSSLACDSVLLKCETSVKPFIEQANGLNLRKLWQNSSLPSSQSLSVDIVGGDVNRINYIINRPADEALEAAFLVSTGLTITLQIIQIVKNISDGAFGSLTDPWLALSTALQIIAVGIAIVSALISVSELLIDRIRQYYCVKLKPLLEKACLSLGFVFESSILEEADWSKIALIGETGTTGVKPSGTPQNNPIPDMTLGDLLGELEKIFTARVKVNGTTVRLETREFYFQNPSSFQIQNTQDTPERSVPNVSYNLGELPASYKFSFAKDGFDNNTRDDFTGTKIVATYTPSGISGELNNLSSQVDNSTRFARASRREEQSTIETIFNSISDEVNGFFGTPVASGGDRIGMLELDADFIGVPKMFIFNEERGRVLPVSNDKINAEYLYNNYHRKHYSPAGEWARWTIFRGIAEQPICSGDGGNADVIIAQLRENNVCTDFLGNISVLEAHVYSNESKLHEFQYRTRGWLDPFNDFAELGDPSIDEQITLDE